jgi:hypothetical protein
MTWRSRARVRPDPRLRRTLALALVAMLAAPSSATAQQIVVRGAGRSTVGRIVSKAIAAPHTVLRSDVGIVDLPRDSTFGTTVLILGSDATVASRVHGDVIVVGGDLTLHPGADIDGDAIAIGGGYYDSTLGRVRGSRLSFRDETFLVSDSAGLIVLDYKRLEGEPRIPLVGLPGLFGLRVPTYDRVNGLSVPFGPELTVAGGRLIAEPIATYRSDLGLLDPGLQASAALAPRLRTHFAARRTTLTNDAWIWSDLRNSISALLAGRDARNYYRADRIDVSLVRPSRGGRVAFVPELGAATERAWSVGPEVGASSAPFSFFERRDRVEGMLRPNPPVDHGRITSGYGGGRLVYSEQQVEAELSATTEVPFQTVGDRDFVQTTLDGRIAFPTFGAQRFQFDIHSVLTAGDSTPRQRFAYLGGSGTLPTFDPMQFGGDQLFFAESRYTVPITAIDLPFVGSPSVTLRHLIGSAGIASLPRFEQNLGVRLELFPARLDFFIDPRTRRTHFSVSPALSPR